MTDTTRDHGVFTKLYNGETDFDFIGRWKRWFAISGLVVLAGVAGLLTRGLNLGIDFEGGVSWEVPAGDTSEVDLREAVEAAGLEQAKVQTLGTASGETLRVQAEEIADDQLERVTEVILEETGADASELSFNEVGPSWGEEISEKAVRALVVFLVLVSIYIALRFEWKMALATLAALFHDILVTVGVYAVLHLPVTPATVIAFLTILGYSIYDGIVVFDRVDENAKKLVAAPDEPYSAMVNRSMNQVLMRTLNTSVTAMFPIASLLIVGSLILGATALEEFALALLVGLLSGAYSSIFIASPLFALLKEREEKWSAVRRRVEGRTLTPTAAVATAPAGDAPASTSGPLAPRGRKKGKRR